MRSRGSVARVEDLDDLISQRRPAAAMSFGPDDVDVPAIQIDLIGLQGAGFTGPQPPYLSRYMGHATFDSTYYYVHTSPDFMATYADITRQRQSLLPQVGF